MDLISSFKLIFRVCQTFGIAPYRFKRNNHRNKLSESSKAVGYSIIVFILYVLMAGIFFVMLPGHFALLFRVPSTTVKTLFLMVFSANAFSVYVTAIRKKKLICHCNNFINGRCSKRTFKKLASFNRNLVFWYSYWHFVVNGVSFFSKLSIFTQFRIIQMFEWIFLSLWSLPEDFFICQIMCFMNVANFKLEQINKRLTEEFKLVGGLKELRWLRAEDMFVKDYVEILTQVFQYSLLFHISQLFMSALSLTFEMVLEDAEKIHIFGFLIYILSRLIPVFTVFEVTRKKAEKTANYVHDLFLDNDDPEIKEEIEIFSLQLQHRKVEFNACGFFKMDFTLLYSMIGSVTTYIIILMQFQKEDPTAIKWRAKKLANCSMLFHHYSVADVYHCMSNNSRPT